MPSAERLLALRLARHRWVLPLVDLAGVCEMPPLRALPRVPHPVLGLAHRHGRIVTVLDLPALLRDGPGEGPDSLLLLASPRAHFGLRVRGDLRLTLPDAGGEDGPLLRVDLASLLA
ncbi:MAG TPA: chemotaxis protein CheW [Candidatus Polarisedimenticolaceae bacterium]|nr:chemotaxis protein CheW [Candidatus Polarisedimenticolaceae bacterium]